MRRPLVWLPLAFIVLTAFALRVYHLDFYPLRGDESFTVLFVQKPFGQMWNEIRTVEPNPPLMYLLLRGWVAVAGPGEFASRYFSVFWGVLCVPLIYRLALTVTRPVPTVPDARSISPRTGIGQGLALIAAFLVAINPYQIWHSQDVRNYTMWPALSLLALVCFWKWRNAVSGDGTRAPPRRYLIFFILAELAALYTHYYEAFILLAVNLYMLLFIWRRRKELGRKSPAVWQWMIAQFALAILYLPFPLLISNRVSSYGEGSGMQGLALWTIWQRTLTTFMLGETIDQSIRNYAWIPLALVVLLTLFWKWRRERRGLFFILYIGVPTVSIFLLNLTRPLYLDRYLNGIAPAYYILFAMGIGWLAENRPALGRTSIPDRRLLAVLPLVIMCLLSLLALSNYFYNPAYAKAPDWRGLAAVVTSERQDGDIILQNFPETSFVYYDRSRLPLVLYPQSFLPDASTVSSLVALNSKYKRVWFIPAAPDYWDPNQFVETWLNRHDDFLSETRVSDFRLRLYNTPHQFLNTMTPVDSVLGGFAALKGYRIDQEPDHLIAVLYWSPLTTTTKSYHVSITLSAGDRLLAEVQHKPVDDGYPTSEWQKNEVIVDRYELPSDPKADGLKVAMLDPATSIRLSVTDPAGNGLGDSILLPLSSPQ